MRHLQTVVGWKKWSELIMINRVVLAGRLTKDPEFRQTASGVSVTTFTLAVNRTFKNKTAKEKQIS